MRLRLAPRTRRAWTRAAALTAVAGGLTAFTAVTRRVAVIERVVEEAVEAPVRRVRTAVLARGWEVVLEAGRPGRALAYVRERSRGGISLGREVIERRLIRAPRTEVRLAGTNPVDNPVHAPRITRAVRAHRMLATAYDPGPHDNGWANAGTTKLGWRTRRGIVAVDPAVIPLRTLLFVEGYGLAWAGDTGGAIKGDRLDLCFNRTEEAVRWGRRTARAWVLEGVRD